MYWTSEQRSKTGLQITMKLRYLNNPCKICELMWLVATKPVNIFGFVLTWKVSVLKDLSHTLLVKWVSGQEALPTVKCSQAGLFSPQPDLQQQ